MPSSRRRCPPSSTTARTSSSLSHADAALSELSIAGEQLPNPHLLIAPFLRQEAVLSSRIEGTRTTLSKLFMDEVAAAPPERDPSDLREVRNYVEALEYGLARLGELPLSHRFVRELEVVARAKEAECREQAIGRAALSRRRSRA